MSTLIAPDVIIGCRHDGITVADLNDNLRAGCGLAGIVTGRIQPCIDVISLISVSHCVTLHII
nr:MAG TPA: hypothetical protein [Caudoviricetes sp.]